MNVREAKDVNLLLKAVLDGRLEQDQAREAAERLADRAHHTLMTGLTGPGVRLGWRNRRSS